MKNRNAAKWLTRGYAALVGALSAVTIAVLACRYSALPERVPVYLAPWGGAIADAGKSLFYVVRLPVMALCLQALLLGLYPERAEGWPEAAYRHMLGVLMGLSLITLSQLTLNPYFTLGGAAPAYVSMLLCALLAGGLALAVCGYLGIRRALKPLCREGKTPFALMTDFIASGCRRRRWLLIGATAAFMVLLVIPSL